MKRFDDEREIHEGDEHQIKLVEATEDAPEAFEATEEVFDFVTATIQSFWQCTPLAAVLGDKEDRVDHVEILVRDVASLQRQVRLDARVLLCRDFDPRGLTFSVNTRALEYSKPRPIV